MIKNDIADCLIDRYTQSHVKMIEVEGESAHLIFNDAKLKNIFLFIVINSFKNIFYNTSYIFHDKSVCKSINIGYVGVLVILEFLSPSFNERNDI